eukprot:314182_1
MSNVVTCSNTNNGIKNIISKASELAPNKKQLMQEINQIEEKEYNDKPDDTIEGDKDDIDNKDNEENNNIGNGESESDGIWYGGDNELSNEKKKPYKQKAALLRKKYKNDMTNYEQIQKLKKKEQEIVNQNNTNTLEDDLENKDKEELKQLCKEKHLYCKGDKETLIARLMDPNNDDN